MECDMSARIKDGNVEGILMQRDRVFALESTKKIVRNQLGYKGQIYKTTTSLLLKTTKSYCEHSLSIGLQYGYCSKELYW